MAANDKWSHSFCAACTPFENCLCGSFTPCFLYGRTQARLQDDTLKDFSYFNGDCFLWGALCLLGFQWIPQSMKRGEMRKRFRIKGSCIGDCCGAYWCPCCGLVQEEKEAVIRTANDQGYQPTQSMTYNA